MNNNVSIKNEKNKIQIDFINSTIKLSEIKFEKINNASTHSISLNLKCNNFLLSKKLDDFFLGKRKTKIFFKKYIRTIEYINKLINIRKEIKFKNIENQSGDLISKVTKSFMYIIKDNINSKNCSLNQKFIRILIVMAYNNILPIEILILIISIFINIVIDIIVKEAQIIGNSSKLNKTPMCFINDLFNALVSIPQEFINRIIHIKLIGQIITILEQNIFKYPYNIHANKLHLWLKLLENKIISSDSKTQIHYDRILSFLIKIYKFSFDSVFLYKNIYEKSAVSFDYYVNSLDFLCELFGEEQSQRLSNAFIIKDGFYIYNNTPLSLNNVQIKTNCYTLIFSFRLTKISNNTEDTLLLDLINNSKKSILKISLDQSSKILKVIGKKNVEWSTNVAIDLNKDYLICITQEKKMLIEKKKISLYINNIETKNEKDPNKSSHEHLTSNLFDFIDFEQSVTLELGKNNFEGIFGDVILINKKIKSNEIFHVYNLKENYSEVICSINNRYDFTLKKKNYTKENSDIIFLSNLKYQCILKLLSKEVQNISNEKKSIIIKPYGELKYLKNRNETNSIKENDNKNNDNMNVKIYHMSYSIINFIFQHGLDFLTFQLHKMKSLIDDNELLNLCLYKTLHTVLELIKMADEIFFIEKVKNKVKVENKLYTFLISLVTVLNSKNRNFDFDEKMRGVLLDFGEIFQKKNTTILQDLNFSILFDTRLFKRNNIINYNRLFDEMIYHIKNNDKNNSIFMFNKLLLFDDFFEIKSKETKHKNYMKIISYFLTENKKVKTKDSINDNFIQYFINIKSPKKIYHYLKIIYYNFDSLKSYYNENENFIKYIFCNYNKINDNNCKYCRNIQILCFLLYDIKINENQNNSVFSYAPYGFMTSPNYNFIRCIFIQCFHINNRQKLKFIKSSLYFENEIDILLNIIGKGNINILSLIDFQYFIPKLEGIIKYFCYIYNQYSSSSDLYLLKLLKKSIKLITDFLDKVIKIDEIGKKEINNSENEFISKLFTSSCIKLVFILYFNIYNEQELKDLKTIDKYMSFSLNRVYNPFYFYLLLPFINLNNNLKINKYYKTELLKMIIKNIILSYNTIKIKSVDLSNDNKAKIASDNLILNSIVILIRIYNIIQSNDNSFMMSAAQKTIINYLKYILENNYLFSKYIFNINLLDENVIVNEQKIKSNKNNIKEKKKKLSTEKEKEKEKEKKYYKFLSEITLDIVFYLLNKKEDPDLISLLYSSLKIKENNSIFFEIDDYFLSESNNNKNINAFNSSIIQLLNDQKINTDYCDATNQDSILNSIYFFTYFFYKLKYTTKKLKEEKKNSKNDLTTFINKALEMIFKDCISIIHKYFKQIKKNKSKVTIDEVQFKIYYIMLDHFLSKYKDNNFKFIESNQIFAYFQKYLKSSKLMHKIEKNYKSSLNLFDNSDLSILDKSDPSINILSKYRKSSFFPDEGGLLLRIKQKDSINNRNAEYKSFTSKRSNSLTDDLIRYNNIIEKLNKDRIENDNNFKIKTPKLPTKETKKNFDISDLSYSKDISTVNTNVNIIDESNSENSIYENNNLNYNSNYQCNNYVNYTDEKYKKRKNAFYLNKKNFISSINLNPNLLSCNENEPEPSEFSYKEEVQNIQKSKLSEDDTRSTINFFIYKMNKNMIEEKNAARDIEIDQNHQYLIDKLKDFDIPYFYYKEINSKDEPKYTKIALIPKREIMRIFGFIFKKFIYNSKLFKKLKYAFKIMYKNIDLEHSIPEEENFSLDYPSKLKNFTCNDYYRPFLKPVLNYSKTEYFYSAHSNLKKSIVEKDIGDEDKIGLIEYEKINLIINKKKSEFRVKCENISNKGSIFGAIHLHNSLMTFEDKSLKDKREVHEKVDQKIFYLFSSDKVDRLKGRNKYMVIYYNEIKEVILRRYCFTDIAYEIFTKDNRSFFFNFFNIDNRKKFFNSLKEKINKFNSKLKEGDKNVGINTYLSNNIAEPLFINEPRSYFEKNDYKNKYIKNELSNFQYLLLVNKFSTRTYNDNNQYLIFPLLYMDTQNKKERKLDKPICMNRELTDEDYLKYENNYETMGYHFNIHYSTMAYINYYLMRMLPFTNCQIKLQSGHFDAPSRMFTSLDNLLYVFSISDENRELIPEFFYNYESFLNLNYNDFGYFNLDKKQIHHFNNNQNCSVIEFIINLRNILEKKELSPWINNIFGSNQINENIKEYNMFPTYSYEQFNNFEKEKEMINEEKSQNVNVKIINEKLKSIRGKMEMLSLGLTPIQLFKYPHPEKEKYSKKKIDNINTSTQENCNQIENGKTYYKKKTINYGINKYLIDFIKKEDLSNVKCIFNNFNCGNLKILFLFENNLKIFSYISENGKDIPEKNISLEENMNILNIKPYRNLFVELYENVYLLCRLSNNTLLLFSEKQKNFIEWPCAITAIESYTHHHKSIPSTNSEIYINKIFSGDAEGYISIIEIITEYNEKKKEFKIVSLSNNFKRSKAHYSFINGIIYNQRLNIIISSCEKGYITINNAYSFEFLNIIQIGYHINVIDFKLSSYDLLYIYTEEKCNNKDIFNLYCYTLNGVKISKLIREKEFVNFYINNTSAYIINKDGSCKEYNCTNFKEIENHIKKEEANSITKTGENALHCICNSKLLKIFIIFNKNYKEIKINNNY